MQRIGHDENDPYWKLAWAFIVHDLPNGAHEVRESVMELTGDKDSAVEAMLALCALCLGGDFDLVQKLRI